MHTALSRLIGIVLLLAGLGAAASGCASSACKAGEQCSDEVDLSDTATSDDVADTSDGDAPDTADEGDTDASDTSDTSDTIDTHDADMVSTTCVPNRDGVVARSELVLRPGLDARFRVADDVDNLDLAGTALGDGRRRWDFGADFNASEHLELSELRALDGQWFAADFPNATYFTALPAGGYLGVFQATDEALLLVGVVSVEKSLNFTRLTYDPPVTVLAFPLERGAAWSTASTVSGHLEGVAAWYTEAYTYAVDAAGELVTPFATFEALRVSSQLERQVGAVFTSRRTTLFVTECFGTVATAISNDYESEVEFTSASQVRRLAP